jgi:hypothetical protein
MIHTYAFGQLVIAMRGERLLCVAVAAHDVSTSTVRRRRSGSPMRLNVSWAGVS